MIRNVGTIVITIGVTVAAMAAEKPEYTVIQEEGNFQLREYKPYIVAETTVGGEDFSEVSNNGFRILADYIFGNNTKRESLEMTSPVTIEESQEQSVKIPMTSPVEMYGKDGTYVMTFMMPSEYMMETLPLPNDERVKLREIPARRVAAIEFSGGWSQESARERTEELKVWMSQQGLTAAGEPIFARYDPPFVPWFLRHNEILVPVAE
jgi:effector-binding domain-containing protein